HSLPWGKELEERGSTPATEESLPQGRECTVHTRVRKEEYARQVCLAREEGRVHSPFARVGNPQSSQPCGRDGQSPF
ncbi:MAG: hypothetical protein SVP26_06265, partial [Chloroflexota bacterium]|nr:hypothetical protein [Chloroflexota bacterium]